MEKTARICSLHPCVWWAGNKGGADSVHFLLKVPNRTIRSRDERCDAAPLIVTEDLLEARARKQALKKMLDQVPDRPPVLGDER
ncbi:MAG: hypothetical protein JW741_27145 [Sedimentisphaerales bacterium]|nr:hypothetical protein [Sedimentisphaerales bacterium]